MHMKAESCFVTRPQSLYFLSTSAGATATRHGPMFATSQLMPHLFLRLEKKKQNPKLVYLEDSEASCYYFLLKFLYVGSISEFTGPQRPPLPEPSVNLPLLVFF